jgi:hypothetical protein
VETPPGSCSVAFKEWAGVCDALARGRQSIILRKGGIREEPGPGAFVPEHDAFWLYPTAVHQAQQGLRADVEGPSMIGDLHGPTIPIGLLARVEWIGRVRDESILPELEPFHVLTAETVRGRFHYRAPGLWILATRIWRREPPFAIAATPEHAGCKTWVQLEQALSTSGLAAALDDAEWSLRMARLRSILGDGAVLGDGARIPEQA